MPGFGVPCDGCSAPCCRKYLVNVNAFDVFRIANTLRAPVDEFAELRWVNQSELDYRILLATNVPEAERRYHRITLRRLPDPETEHRCIFLVQLGNRGRCGIYGCRPDVCATYPTSYHDGLIGLGGGGKYCPPGGWQMEGVDVPTQRVRHRHRLKHKVLHDTLVDAWNARLLAANEEWSERYFFNFVMNVYRDLEKRDPAIVVEDDLVHGDEQLKSAMNDTLRAIGWL